MCCAAGRCLIFGVATGRSHQPVDAKNLVHQIFRHMESACAAAMIRHSAVHMFQMGLKCQVHIAGISPQIDSIPRLVDEADSQIVITSELFNFLDCCIVRPECFFERRAGYTDVPNRLFSPDSGLLFCSRLLELSVIRTSIGSSPLCRLSRELRLPACSRFRVKGLFFLFACKAPLAEKGDN